MGELVARVARSRHLPDRQWGQARGNFRRRKPRRWRRLARRWAGINLMHNKPMHRKL